MCGSATSWNESRSPVTTTTSMPSAAARVASVAITSSASTPATFSWRISSASSTSWMSGSCDAKRSGVSLRPGLVVGVEVVAVGAAAGRVERDRDVIGLLVGRRTLASIDVKP